MSSELWSPQPFNKVTIIQPIWVMSLMLYELEILGAEDQSNLNLDLQNGCNYKE